MNSRNPLVQMASFQIYKRRQQFCSIIRVAFTTRPSLQNLNSLTMKSAVIIALVLAVFLINTISCSDAEEQKVLRRFARASVKPSCVNRRCTINGHCSDCCRFPNVGLCSFKTCTCL